jgi:hypothetical protein
VPNYTTIPEKDQEALTEKMRAYKRRVRLEADREAEKKSVECVEVTVYADMLRVHQDMRGEMQGGGKREACKGFSEDSRRRLIQQMAMWNMNGLYCCFVTLTYPAVYSDDWHIWKRDLDAYLKRVQRRYKSLVGCFWRVEFQKRGAPHYHLIMAFDEPVCSCDGGVRKVVDGREMWVHRPGCKIAHFRAETALAWAECVKEGYRAWGGDMSLYAEHFEKNKRAGTGVEDMRDRKQVVNYVAKYMTKNDQKNAPDEWGRSWGHRNINGELDFDPVETIKLQYRQGITLKRLVKKWLKSRGKQRYAKMLMMRANYSVLGLGADSEDNRAVYKMLGGAAKGLFAPHILPLESGSGPGAVPLTFIERVQLGMYPIRAGLVEGLRVNTPRGAGEISMIRPCPILKRVRVSVILDYKQSGGSRFGAFDVWEVRPVERVECKQEALF